jgi:multiple sugar transport system substrate-binding protein
MNVFKRPFAVIMAVVVLLGQGCTKGVSPETQALAKRVPINVWGVEDDVDKYQAIFATFRKSHPFADIRFKRFRFEEYEEELLNAMAEDRGPDVFLIHNTWVDKYIPKMLPAPKTVKAAYQVASGGRTNQQVTYEARTVPLISLRALKEDFPDFVAKDAIRSMNVSKDANKKLFEDRVMGLPISVDTLALYYNKDILNASGIATPPENWDQFQAQVKRITRYGDDGAIVRAGAGFGLGSNVERSPDILSLLMLQNRTVMTDDNGNPTFTRIPAELRETAEMPPGLQALQFYADFANPAKDTYTWNAEQPNSLDAFMRGTSAFFVGYSYHLPLIRARAPKLNLGITNVPQIAGNPEAHVANYWMWTVSKKSASADLAWLLVNDMTGKDGATTFLTTAQKPAIRKALLESQLEDEQIGVFASQVLTAHTWYRGVDPKAAERAFIELLDAAPLAKDADDLRKLLRTAEEKVSQTIR